MFKSEITTVEQWDAIVERCCPFKGATEIAGSPVDARFESLPKDGIADCQDTYLEYGETHLAWLNEELSLHVLDAIEVDPAKDRYNWKRGTGKDAIYYLCRNNLHNRISATGVIGDPTTSGLSYDMAHGFWSIGPMAYVDIQGQILSFAHRLKAYLKAVDAGYNPKVGILVNFGCPPQLVAIFDRNKPKTGSDQEFMDRNNFRHDFLVTMLDDAMPEDCDKLRNELSKNLVTVRNNLWSRFHGTGYHPSKRNQPTERQALRLQGQFPESSVDASQTELHELLVRVWSASRTEDGKKTLWLQSGITVPMVAALVVLASNRDAEQFSEDTVIRVDWTVADTILENLGLCSDKGDEGYSSFLREIATIKKAAKKPTGFDRWLFWGLVSATESILTEEYDSSMGYFPNVTQKLVKQLKDGKVAEPIFGGLDCGIVDSPESDD